MSTQSVHAIRFHRAEPTAVADILAVEAPLHLKVNGESWTTTMRTPGADLELARGLAFTEGIVPEPHAPIAFHCVQDPETGLTACVDISVAPEFVARPVEGRRSMLSSSSCGVCGIVDPADINLYGPPLIATAEVHFDLAQVPAMHEALSLGQALFQDSGGSHAAALYSQSGQILALHEDIGRHNAVDKAVGALLASGRLAEARALFVSGRVSYEIVYKAYRAGVPVLLAVSAPSSMAVETAQRMGICLIAFCRDDRATVYSHAENIATAAEIKESTSWTA